MLKNSTPTSTSDTTSSPNLQRRILAALDGLQYGAVEITIHDGKIVQIERREKFRLPTHSSANN